MKSPVRQRNVRPMKEEPHDESHSGRPFQDKALLKIRDWNGFFRKTQKCRQNFTLAHRNSKRLQHSKDGNATTQWIRKKISNIIAGIEASE